MVLVLRREQYDGNKSWILRSSKETQDTLPPSRSRRCRKRPETFWTWRRKQDRSNWNDAKYFERFHYEKSIGWILLGDELSHCSPFGIFE